MKNYLITTAVVLVLLGVGLEFSLARKPRPQWNHHITTCENYNKSCAISCRIKAQATTFCHSDTGYCICPPKAKPAPNCRQPIGAEEMEICNTFDCAVAKTDPSPSANRGQNTGRKQSKSKTIEMIQEGTNERKIPTALVCINDQDGTMHCACFLHKNKARKVIIINENDKSNKKVSQRFGNGK